ncbi:MAG: 2-oxoglutarate synthase [Alphaproteobacteria bacterium RIFOXYD12_FULL_60_8]|nr:MAG: 2-oxoglutarate synthase [Alphaproteobacteria bacterium RIFOXYD12_FULL_60_8]
MIPKDYKSDMKPVWCPGCGDFGVVAAITRALSEMQLPRHQVALVSGIGCSSRLPAYTTVYGFHGVHGRALPVASGLKTARPDLTVIAMGGDGDGFSIGANHFVQACRRNLDLTYIVMDNEVYGMTKGQASPTTEADWTMSQLTPHGPGIEPFRPLEVALAAGANFIARAFAGDPAHLTRLIVEAVATPGFAFINVLSPCVTFRAEQKLWKERVHEGFGEPTADRGEAYRRLMQDDGFTLGALYKGNFQPHSPYAEAPVNIADMEARFRV